MISIEAHGIPELRARMTAAEMAQAQAARQIVNRLAIIMRSFLRQTAPQGKDKVNYAGQVLRQGGTLRRSIRFETLGEGQGVIARFYADRVSKFVIAGTAPHEIWAGFYNGRAGQKALWWPGATHPTPYVRHPGTRANDFRLPALRRTAEESHAVLAEEAPKFIRGL